MTGKSFGFITKDINPIHMSSLLAKAFGFKQDLAHGMWALARANKAIFENIEYNKPIRLDVSFKGPVYISDHVKVYNCSTNRDVFEYYSGKNERPSIIANIENVSDGSSLI